MPGDVSLYVGIVCPGGTLAFPCPKSHGFVNLDICAWATPFFPSYQVHVMSVFPTLIQLLSTCDPHFQKVLRCKLEAASVQ